MRLTSLALHNFRNFKMAEVVDFPEAPLLAAVAPNATGKTNFLEAIAVLLRSKSFRARHEECVRWGEESFVVRGGVVVEEEQRQLAVQYNKANKMLRVEEDGAPVSPVLFYGRYPYVLFLPEDTFMFERGPAVRRNFINTALVGSGQYLSAVVQYQRVLKQRNAALKRAQDPVDVAAWTQLLVQHANVLWRYRQALVEFLQEQVTTRYGDLFEEVYDFTVRLVPGVEEIERYEEELLASWDQERRYQYTLHGPHRDDLEVKVGSRQAQAALSRGQMRSLVITLKIVAFEFIRQMVGHEPLLLFDEVLSELDEGRQRRLLQHLPSTQMLLTCTAIPEGIKRQDGLCVLDLTDIMESQENQNMADELMVEEDVEVGEDETEESSVLVNV